MTPVELTTLLGVLVALLSSVGVPVYLSRRKERAAAVTRVDKNDANLRDDQREFIAVLQKENANWRREVESLRHTVENLRAEIETLRADLAAERRARQSSEARVAAETERRIAGAAATVTEAEGERPVIEAGRLPEPQEAGRPNTDE